MAADSSVRALLFDLGKVVIDFDFEHAFAAWQPLSRLAPAELRAAWRPDEAYARHETGELPAAGYCAHLRETLQLEGDDATLLAGWNGIFRTPIAGTVALIDQVRGRLPCYAFSNTNPSHLARLRGAYGDVLARFVHVFASPEIGLRKPHVEAYAHVVARMGCAPGEVLFFDDLAENVEGAAACGLQAVLFRSPEDVRDALATRGLLD